MGTISDKLEYLNDTKQDIKNVMNYAGAGIESFTAFRAYPEKLYNSYTDILNKGVDNLFNSIPKRTDIESGSNLTINDTIETSMKIALAPNGLEQASTTGKNLWVSSGLTASTLQGVTFTPIYDENGELKYINANGTASATAFYNLYHLTLPAGSYIINGCKGGSSGTYQLGINFTNLSTNRINQYDADVTFTTTEESTFYEAFIRIISGATINNVKFYPMVRLANISDSTYEPYTNGPSPNPDYPQDIHTISGDNEIKVENKNLINLLELTQRLSGATLSNKQTNSITLNGTSSWGNAYYYFKNSKKNTTYALSCKLISSLARQSGTTVYGTAATSGTELINIKAAIMPIPANTSTNSTNVFNSGEYEYIVLRFWNNASSTALSSNVDLNISEIQLEEKSTVSNYESYKEQSLLLNLPVKNLFDKDNVTFTVGILDDNGQPTGSTTSKYTNQFYNVKPNNTYTISGTVRTSTSSYRLYYYNNNEQWISRTEALNNVPYTFTTPNNCYKIRIQVFYELTLKTGDVQLEPGTKANSYTPYGTTPLEYCKIGDYEDEFVIPSGSNLFNKNTVVEGYIQADGIISSNTGYYTSDFIPIKPNTSYYKTRTGTPRSKYYDKNKQLLNTTSYQDISIGANAGTFTTPDNAYYMRLSTRDNVILVDDVMVNEGTTALPYEPYNDGKWYLKKNVGKYIFTGNENIITGTYGVNSWVFSNLLPVYFNTSQKLIMSNIFKGVSNDDRGAGDNIIFVASTTQIWIRNTSLSTEQDVKNAITNQLAYYVLATPQYILLNDTLQSQLNDIYGYLKSYNEQTNIIQENNDLPFVITPTIIKKYETTINE